MEEENFIQKNKLPIAAGIMILFGFAVSIIPLAIPFIHCRRHHLPGNLIGINLTLIVAGTLFIAFWIIRQWMISIDHVNKLAEKETDHKNFLEQQKLLKTDAEARRLIDQERNTINDLFRLIDLAKDKHEKSESVPGGEKSDKFHVRIIDKSEELDFKKLETLIQHYNKLITTHPNTETHV